MADNKYTIEEIASLKECSVDELLLIAKGKGLNLPSDPNYKLSISEIGLIDRILVYKIRAQKQQKKEPSSHNSNSAQQKETNTIGHDWKEQLNAEKEELKETPQEEKSQPTENESKKEVVHEETKLIGIVKFYDRVYQNFGFLMSNPLGVKGKNRYQSSLIDYHFEGEDCVNDYYPDKNEWVIFTPRFTGKRCNAQNVKPLPYNIETLKWAMKYRGKFAKIQGTDTRHNTTYNFSILGHIIRQTISLIDPLNDLDKVNSIVATFCEFANSQPQKLQHETITDFTSDIDLVNILFKLFYVTTLSFDEENQKRIFEDFKQALVSKIFEKGNIDSLIALPSNFNINNYKREVTSILLREIRKSTIKVREWIRAHITNPEDLELDNDSNTIALRLILVKDTGNAQWVRGLEIGWDSLRDYLSPLTTEEIIYFSKLYYRDREQAFITNNPLASILDEIQKEQIVSRLKTDELTGLDNLRNSIIDEITNIRFIEDLIDNGFDISGHNQLIRNLLSLTIKTSPEVARNFIRECEQEGVPATEWAAEGTGISDELYAELFEETEESDYLEEISDFEQVGQWISKQNPKFVASFICKYGPLIEDDRETDELIPSLGEVCVANALRTLSVADQYQFTNYLPEEFVKNLILSQFANTDLYKIYIKEKWQELKSQIPYIVFDLETDGDDIKEFAFISKGSTNFYENEEQLNVLIQEINNTPIVVGHRIKQWDLKATKLKDKVSPNFVWDTLEIEILLNPCRYAYSLHTTHNAQADTEKAEELFWNQLYRLSKEEGLCQQLSQFLPERIMDLLGKLRQPIFTEYFRAEAGDENQFFQNKIELNQQLTNRLTGITVEEGQAEQQLIVAPKRLWNRISEHVEVTFKQDTDGIDYLPISEEKLKKQPLEDDFLQAILLRFVTLCKTPVVSNLATYIRIQYIDDTQLQKYIEKKEGKIVCADLKIINEQIETNKYSKIYLVGCELENRLNQYTLPQTLNPVDFWEEKSDIPMRLGGSSFTVVTKKDRESQLFDLVPKEAANVWIERNREGKYLVNYNFDIKQRLEEFKKDGGSIEEIEWQSASTDNKAVILVNSAKVKKFDYLQKRVASTTRYRAMYWMYQLALLRDITRITPRPTIYLLENDLELEKVEKYARSTGFYVPTGGTLIRRLEEIAQYTNGLLIASKDQFFEITEKRLDKAYNYVWDQMAVEKHMMMWHNSSLLNDHVAEEGKNEIKGTKDTYQSILLSLWPIFDYYQRFILANNSDSKMYIIEPFLEEYNTLSSIWKTSKHSAEELWNKEEDFKEALTNAQKYFDTEEPNETPTDELGIDKAMEVILSTLIPGAKEWRQDQKEILPRILRKERNYLVSMPTGGGKSVLFQGPALYNASYTNRLTLVVTPLKALMQDQVDELAQKGFCTNVDYLSGDRSYQEIRSIYRKINGGELALLYITPERFRSRAFVNALLTRMTNDHGLEYMVFDEAHCISQWGMEFRPEYLHIIQKCRNLEEQFGSEIRTIMFSATVTDMIYDQINAVIPVTKLGGNRDGNYNPIRNHISTECIPVENDIESREDKIVNYIKEQHINFKLSRMLVFCKTRKLCEEVAKDLPRLLKEKGIFTEDTTDNVVGYFHAGMDAEDRNDTYERFKSADDPIYILCATKAFGMGMDIPNIHYIVHLNPPTVLEDYLQEVGRAGRDKESYTRASFSEERPIPTICLYSDEDIKVAREQLLRDSLSWGHLEEIRRSIIEYITRIQSIEDTNKYPIVIPNDLWRQNEKDYNYTDLKIGEYWLEKLKRIKLGFLSPAHIVIRINHEFDAATTLDNGGIAYKVYKKIEETANGKDTIQVSLQQLARDLSIHPTYVINGLIKCAEYKILTVNQEVRCQIPNTRFDEVPYMLEHKDIDLAFHIIINAATTLLEENKIKVERIYNAEEIKQFIVTDKLDQYLKPIHRTNKKGETEVIKYMPWYEGKDNNNKGLEKATSYKRDLINKRLKHIFSTLLDIVPDVKCRSYIDRENKTVKQSVLIEKNTWREFLPEFKDDCIKTLSYIFELQKQNTPTFNWVEAINKLGFTEKGYNYFNNILRFLICLAYIKTDNLLPTGIEVYTTEQTKDNIVEEPENEDLAIKEEFEQARRIKHLRLCVMDVLTQHIEDREEFNRLVNDYFTVREEGDLIKLLERYYNDDDPMWGAIREDAIKDEEAKMRGNKEQWAIYNEDVNTNVNVEAGPGSGKTHVLTMRCAKLIYRQHVLPRDILVLAYNRAVVVELKSRLSRLFTALGLGRSANQLNVYTFSGFAKKICGTRLEDKDMKEWEDIFLGLLKENPLEITKQLPNIKYILIDEFQDINQTRLNAMFELDKIYNQPAFFTIGDKDQSIYGFEKKESTDPQFYYDQLYSTLHSKCMSMSTNYRSYPNILKEAARFLPENSKMPVACEKNTKEEPKERYTFIYEKGEDWTTEIKATIEECKNKGMKDVAIFYRSNNEVYYGYSIIQKLDLKGVRIRIQGASECELYRKREVYTIIKFLENGASTEIRQGTTENKIREKVEGWINHYSNWDVFYLDFAFTICLDYINLIRTDDRVHTYGNMAEHIKQMLEEDNPQLYKVYDKYANDRIIKEQKMNVILTTMHKVKGLEFDAVVVTPSVSPLPFKTTALPFEEGLTDKDRESIEEEKRLLYVAFTRAKKYLKAYLGEREKCVISGEQYKGAEQNLGIKEKEPGLSNYNIGFYVTKSRKEILNILKEVSSNTPIIINKAYDEECYWIMSNGKAIGKLSRSSTISKEMRINNISTLEGFFVNNVYNWTYKDTLKADARAEKKTGRNPNFASNWREEAKQTGIFIVTISGYGK